jgi:hypothetical protein
MLDISEILTVLLVGVLVPLIGQLIGTYLKRKIAAQPQRLKITAPSGHSLTIELKEHRSKEETADLLRSLEELERRAARSSSTSLPL